MEIEKLKQERVEFIAYVNDAKAALGEDTYSGQPLAEAIRDLKADRDSLRVEVDALTAQCDTQAAELTALRSEADAERIARLRETIEALTKRAEGAEQAASLLADEVHRREDERDRASKAAQAERDARVQAAHNEREAIAKMVDTFGGPLTRGEIAAAIRARGGGA